MFIGAALAGVAGALTAPLVAPTPYMGHPVIITGFISFFFAPRGLRPGLGAADPPSRFSLFMLRWEWFRIYFESGVVKIASGDPQWRHLTAMDEYYQNGPLPAWPGWYVQHFPHWYHAATVVFTLFVEWILVWAVFQPGSCVGTQTTLSSSPFSSRIRNRAIGLTGITQPGKVGSETQTIASSGSPSRPRLPIKTP